MQVLRTNLQDSEVWTDTVQDSHWQGQGRFGLRFQTYGLEFTLPIV